jgi:hypothetical protein
MPYAPTKMEATGIQYNTMLELIRLLAVRMQWVDSVS